MSYGDAIEALTTAPQQRTITFTIPEGLSRREIAPLARQAGIGGSYIEASTRSRELRPNDFGAQGRARSLEGFLFPATYELNTGSPYNTRLNAGLPPGPIGNPGIASIRAAAHPANVNYVFYVVKPGT